MLRKWEFSDEITVAIVLYQKSEREAMLIYLAIPVGFELLSW